MFSNLTEDEESGQKQGEWTEWTHWIGCHCRISDERMRVCKTKSDETVENCNETIADGTTSYPGIQFQNKQCKQESYCRYPIILPRI